MTFRLSGLPDSPFAKNDVGFIDPTGVDHDALGRSLKKAIYNFMHGIGIEQDVRRWFDIRVPKPTVPRQGHPALGPAQMYGSVYGPPAHHPSIASFPRRPRGDRPSAGWRNQVWRVRSAGDIFRSRNE